MKPRDRALRFEALYTIGCICCAINLALASPRLFATGLPCEIHHQNKGGYAGQERIGDHAAVHLAPPRAPAPRLQPWANDGHLWPELAARLEEVPRVLRPRRRSPRAGGRTNCTTTPESSMNTLAIDPGTTESGWVLMDGATILGHGIDQNPELLARLRGFGFGDKLDAVSEMIASYGMPVGREVFITCCWIGRFAEAFAHSYGREMALLERQTVKLHLCGSPRAKDPNVRQALLDLIGPQGTKKAPGPTYGITKHVWAALGVGATYLNLRPAEQAARAA